MHYRLDDILAFLQAMETGSISTAAQRMGLAKSVVSKRISDLEAVLKVELLHRSTRGVVPTDKGTAFYQRARSIMQQLDQAAEELIEQGDELCGSLRIAAPMTFGTTYLGPILFSFLSHHPRLGLALDLDDRITDLPGEGYDLGVRIGRLRDSSLVARKLAVSRRVVCCSPAYAQRAGLPATIEELADHACVGYVNVSPGQIWQFEPAEPGGAPRSLVVRSRIIANNGESMRDAAIAGLGISVLPVFIVAKALASGQLINALPDVCPVADAIYAVYPRNRHLPKKVRAVIDHLIAVFEGEPPWERELNRA
ncbi:transcriptional regulator, LysR family [Nitrosospira sp. Nl5]|uniref:LysR family transcriptional regulator n=1 Tax=Nitrosospira sp. Nl5 TaxID=200120 RepID=UPI000882BDBB|nr:LysR family transcriptional regulator [Nitrosospira sp. Nl5]SCY04306.1 transcriptional regulator, LysR family [Nitrosospira sp. Nl5]